MAVTLDKSHQIDYVGLAMKLEELDVENLHINSVASFGPTEVVTTTNVITADEGGSTFILNSATAFVSTLPAPAAGLRFRFIAGATQVTGGNHTIVTNGGSNIIYGVINFTTSVPASAEDSINLIADTVLPGDWVELHSDGTNWYLLGSMSATGAITVTAT
jgi:hypothetical protein